jgi:RNA polymerase sigma-70 factor (ECF subfamily)
VNRADDAGPLPFAGAAPLDAAAVHAAHADFVWASLHRLGIRSADLPDLLQEVFVVVHRRGDSFDGSSELRTWLFGICVGLARNYRKKAFRRNERPLEREQTSDEDPEREIADRLARRAAERILERIDPEKRAVFVMFEVEQLSCPEIAHALGLPVGTVYSRLHAARAEIAVLLARWKKKEGL